MTFSRPLRGYRNLQRLTQIINDFVKHGFCYLAVQLRLRKILPLRRRFGAARKEPQTVTIPERIRLAFEELGPTFIKLSQILSSRSDLVSPPFVEELKRLQDKVPSFPFEQIKETIERELGGPYRGTLFFLLRNPGYGCLDCPGASGPLAGWRGGDREGPETPNRKDHRGRHALVAGARSTPRKARNGDSLL